MAKIELKFISSIKGRRSSNKGSVIPPWVGNVDDYSKWYSSPQVSYFYNMIEGVTNTMYIQYGRNAEGWGSGRFFIQELKITSEKELANGDITVDVESRMKQFNQRRTQMTGTPFDVNYQLKVLGNTVFSYKGNAGDKIDRGASQWYTKKFTVKPSETVEETGIEFNVSYPNGEVGDSSLFIGFGLFNPNPPTYIPMAIRKNGNWKDLNTNKGKILIRKSGNWIDKSTENISTSREINKGKNRIRKNGNWRQLPPMKNGQPV